MFSRAVVKNVNTVFVSTTSTRSGYNGQKQCRPIGDKQNMSPWYLIWPLDVSRFAEFTVRAHAQRQTRPEVQLDGGDGVKTIAPNRVIYIYVCLLRTARWKLVCVSHFHSVVNHSERLWRQFCGGEDIRWAENSDENVILAKQGCIIISLHLRQNPKYTIVDMQHSKAEN